MASIFAYVVHKDGGVDDSAAELLSAARKVDPDEEPVAITAGFGSDLDSVCETLQRPIGKSGRSLTKPSPIPMLNSCARR